jgi:hypothetical protein
VVAFLAAFFLFKNSYANPGQCYPTSTLMKTIWAEKMVIVFRGLSKNGHLVTVYLNKGGKFLAVVHYKNQTSCIADQGGNGTSKKGYKL